MISRGASSQLPLGAFTLADLGGGRVGFRVPKPIALAIGLTCRTRISWAADPATRTATATLTPTPPVLPERVRRQRLYRATAGWPEARQALRRRAPRRSFAEMLASMPDVGEDADFAPHVTAVR